MPIYTLLSYGVESVKSTEDQKTVTYSFKINEQPLTARKNAVKKCLSERHKLMQGMDVCFGYHRRIRLFIEYRSDLSLCRRTYILDGDPNQDHIIDNLHAEYTEYDLAGRIKQAGDLFEIKDEYGAISKMGIQKDFNNLIYFYDMPKEDV